MSNQEIKVQIEICVDVFRSKWHCYSLLSTILKITSVHVAHHFHSHRFSCHVFDINFFLDREKVLFNIEVKENLMRPAPVIRAPLSTRKIGKKKTKRPIFCRHCNKTFWAKPTAKKSFHVVNHQCSGNPRLQFTVNARNRHRRCHVNHEPPCLIWGDPEKAVRKPGKSRDPLKKIVKRKVQAKLVDPLKIEGNDFDDEWLP